jgi:hypothetical protein
MELHQLESENIENELVSKDLSLVWAECRLEDIEASFQKT